MVGWDAKRAEDTCGIVVVAVRPEGETDFLSSGAHENGFGAGDVLIVLGDRAGVTKLAEFATS